MVRRATFRFLFENLTSCDRNAGGRTSDLTAEIVKTCQSTIGIETCMHLTCTNMPSEKVDIALRVCVLLLVKCLAYVFAGSEIIRLS
jgi:5,10-methylenetetrahydrofolate reductase